jgi:TPP-dependent trihydroxycyclohexane-1,2-dione (THcHDO) dehydratase
MKKVVAPSKKKLEKLLENLEATQGENWKQIVDQNKEEFESIKTKIRQKQDELTSLVRKKNTLMIKNEEFEEQTKIIQQELYDLEARILKMRLQHRK